jgi:hypothetical protein
MRRIMWLFVWLSSFCSSFKTGFFSNFSSSFKLFEHQIFRSSRVHCMGSLECCLKVWLCMKVRLVTTRTVGCILSILCIKLKLEIKQIQIEIYSLQIFRHKIYTLFSYLPCPLRVHSVSSLNWSWELFNLINYGVPHLLCSSLVSFLLRAESSQL